MIPSTENRILSHCGTLLMTAGAVFTLAVFVDNWTDLKIAFPAFWYKTRSFHPLFCAGLFLGGWYCHRSATASSLTGRGEPVFDEVRVYTGHDCSLCDDALAVLTEYARWLPPIQEVDVRSDPQLQKEHGLSIPVVEMDGVIQFRGRVNREVMERLIMSRQNQKSSVTVRDQAEASS